MCPGSPSEELAEELGPSPGLLAPRSGFSCRLHARAPPSPGEGSLPWRGAPPGPPRPSCPGSTALILCQESPVAQLAGRSQAWQPLVGIQAELLFPAPSFARRMASSSKYVLPDRPQLLAGGALGGQGELGANWAQPT